MNFDQASKLVDLLTSIAVRTIERSALDADHWEQADHLTHHIHVERMEAIALLDTEEEPGDEQPRQAGA